MEQYVQSRIALLKLSILEQKRIIEDVLESTSRRIEDDRVLNPLGELQSAGVRFDTYVARLAELQELLREMQ